MQSLKDFQAPSVASTSNASTSASVSECDGRNGVTDEASVSSRTLVDVRPEEPGCPCPDGAPLLDPTDTQHQTAEGAGRQGTQHKAGHPLATQRHAMTHHCDGEITGLLESAKD